MPIPIWGTKGREKYIKDTADEYLFSQEESGLSVLCILGSKDASCDWNAIMWHGWKGMLTYEYLLGSLRDSEIHAFLIFLVIDFFVQHFI